MAKDTSDTAQGPAHVAIIMDGNGRWAQQRGRPRLFGHHAGAKRVREIVESCPVLGVKYLTIFAFSTENWKRTQAEVSGLMLLFRKYIEKEAKALFEDGV
ncbi:MAG: polyprenyl diphosphate synthase, partial [Loktanella sp.]|nr:polyprenyl diphosphate synthase [Loktanella sp.]